MTDAEDLESKEFLTAVLNGQGESEKKVLSLIDLRFQSSARRERERHQRVMDRLDELSTQVTPLLGVVVWGGRAVRFGAPLAAGVAGVGKVLGWY